MSLQGWQIPCVLLSGHEGHWPGICWRTYGDDKVLYQALNATSGSSPASPQAFILLIYPAMISPPSASTKASE